MKTVAITGHTSGIGKVLAERLTLRGYQVIGLSRSNGFDIANHAEIVGAAKQADIFVNNASAAFHQIHLAYAMAEAWKNAPTKLCIHMGSLSSDGIAPDQGMYAVRKGALDKAIRQLQANQKYECKHSLLRFGYTDTPRIAHKDVAKMPVEDVIDTIMYLIDAPWRMEIRRIDFKIWCGKTG